MVYKPEFAFIQFFPDLDWGCSDRLKCLTPFPWIDTSSEDKTSVTSGVSCAGCRHKWVAHIPDPQHGSSRDFAVTRARIDHSHREYITHFLNCPHAIQWWRLNPDGLPPVPKVQPVPGLLRFSMVPHKYLPEKSFRLRDAILAIFELKKRRSLAFTNNTMKRRGTFVIPSSQSIEMDR